MSVLLKLVRCSHAFAENVLQNQQTNKTNKIFDNDVVKSGMKLPQTFLEAWLIQYQDEGVIQNIKYFKLDVFKYLI